MQTINKSDLSEITSDKLYLDSANSKIDQSGLLSEIVFGPIKKYNCACGNLNIKNLHENQVCPKCGVTCVHSDTRYANFGKIVLPIPIIRSSNRKYFKKFVKNFKGILNPKQNDLISSLNIYLYYDPVIDLLELTDKYKMNYCLPIKITGFYSLYIALVTICKKYKSKRAQEYVDMFFQELLVIPPECRIVISVNEDTKQRIIKHKLIDIYTEILRLKNYFFKDNDTYYDTVTNHFNTVNKLYNTTNNKKVLNSSKVILYDTFCSRFQYYIDELYSEVTNVLSGKSGLIRSDFLGKNIDFSARSIVINDPSLMAYEIKIPKKMFFKLWLLEYYRFLKNFKYKDNWNSKSISNMSKLMTPFEKSEINIEFSDYEFYDEFIEYFFEHSKEKDRLIYLNRQPTLWKYGLSGFKIVGLNNHNTIAVSPLMVKAFGMDFDGDSAAIYKVHDNKSKEELYNNAYNLFLNKYDHNDELVHNITNEGVYSFEVLKNSHIDDSCKKQLVQSLESLKYDYKVNINSPIYINSLGVTISYGLALLNKWAEFGTIIIDSSDNIKTACFKIFEHSKNEKEYHKKLRDFHLKIYWFLSTNTSQTLSLPIQETVELANSDNKLLKTLPNNPYVGYHIYSAISDKVYDNLPKGSFLYNLTKSNFRKINFVRSLISIGYIADEKNQVSYNPITTNMVSGLNEDEFFRTSFGTRKGIIDKDKHVPDAGYMQRSIIINLSSLEVIEDDCHSKFGFNIKIQSLRHSLSLINRYYYDDDNKLKLYDASKAKNKDNIGKIFKFRSPVTCQTPGFKICRKCSGEYNFKSPYLGVMAGQYIEERITQLTMSSFHTSGSANLDLYQDFKDFIKDNLETIHNHNDHFELEFNSPIPIDIIRVCINNKDFKYIKHTDNTIMFNNYSCIIENNDINKTAKIINNLLKKQTGQNIIPIDEAYTTVINSLHSISQIYSLFVELLFANSYINKEGSILRYALGNNESVHPIVKHNIKQLHLSQSNVLSLIFQPNEKSILDYYNNPNIIKDHLNIFEKIWLGEL